MFAVSVVCLLLLLVGIPVLLSAGRRTGAVPALSGPSPSSGESSLGEDEQLPDRDAAPVEDPQDQEGEVRDPPVLDRRGLPDEMRAVYLAPGSDFPLSGGEDAIRLGISEAISRAKALTMNCVVICLYTQEGAIYPTGGSSGTDILQIAVEEARAQGLYVYALYHASAASDDGRSGLIDANALGLAAKDAGGLAGKYALDGLLIDSYENPVLPDSYARYVASHASIGFYESMRLQSEALFLAVADAARAQADGIQIGIVVDGASPSNRNADTKQWVEDKRADFVAVRAGGTLGSAGEPFQTAARWWSGIATGSGVPFYMLHDSAKAGTGEADFAAPDELIRQILYARDCAGFGGSIFNSLPRLTENSKGGTDLLLRLYGGQLNVNHVLTSLSVTTPEESTFSTLEPAMVFKGVSDPEFETLLNGEKLDTDEDGRFTVSRDLQAGLNTFTFEHKGKAQVFGITRDVRIIREVTPSGTVEAQGGGKLQVSVSAYADSAYADAEISASLGGTAIPLARDSSGEDGAYAQFSGEFTLPAATGEKQLLGAISVTASWEGVSDSKQGAEVTIEAQAEKRPAAAGKGDLVIVTADSAKTFPTDVLNNESDPAYLPLPKGAKDYAVGDIQTFTNDSGTYQYYSLQSGVRVYAEDIQKAPGTLALGNTISSMKITSDSQYTYVKVRTRDPVPYRAAMSGGTLSFDFHYTDAVPDAQPVSGGPAISSASWSGSKLTLGLAAPSSFLGYTAYYEGDQSLVIRLTNPRAMGGLRVAIDPGHGGKDKGASGYSDVTEAQVNRAIATRTAQALQSMGAKVKLIETDPYLTLTQRLDAACAFDADIFISIHANSSANPGASGTEAYYFYPNGKALATAAASRVSDAMGNDNRGGKQAGYVVTADPRFASILVETGFVSNKSEYAKLTDASYQEGVARGIAQAVADFIGG